MNETPPNETLEEKTNRLRRWEKKLRKREDSLKEREIKLCDEEKTHDFNIEFKSQAYAAFYASAMERDKSLLTISVAGIGFIAAILAKDVPVWGFFVAAISAICFLTCIALLLAVFKLNGSYLLSITKDQYSLTEHLSNNLTTIDKSATVIFYIGILLATFLGLSQAATS